MYCRHCGRSIPNDAKYCPACGLEQDGGMRSGHPLPSAVIILALILLPPLGLLLMWTSSRWSDDTKWLVSGLFFAPLWLRFLWRAHWPVAVKLGAAGAFMIAFFLTLLVYAGRGVALWLTLATLVLLFVLFRSHFAHPSAAGEDTAERRLAARRQAVEATLDSCHAIIAEIEEHTVFDLFPPSSVQRRQYMEALEVRSHAMSLFQHAATQEDLAAAEARATEARNRLQSAQDGLWSAKQIPE